VKKVHFKKDIQKKKKKTFDMSVNPNDLLELMEKHLMITCYSFHNET